MRSRAIHSPSLCLHSLIRNWAENPCPCHTGTQDILEYMNFIQLPILQGCLYRGRKKGEADPSVDSQVRWVRREQTLGPSRTMEGGIVTLSPGQALKQRERRPSQGPYCPVQTGWGGLVQGGLPALRYGNRARLAPPGLRTQTRSIWDSSTYVCISEQGLCMRECLALLPGSLAMSATLCLSFLWPCVSPTMFLHVPPSR